MKRALHVCPIQKCAELISSSRRYCAKHTRERRPVDTRPNFRERGYTWEWDKARVRYLQAHTKCACGCGRKATVVDHIKPHRGNRDLFWDENNWQAMAKICHDRKTVKKDGGFGNE